MAGRQLTTERENVKSNQLLWFETRTWNTFVNLSQRSNCLLLYNNYYVRVSSLLLRHLQFSPGCYLAQLEGRGAGEWFCCPRWQSPRDGKKNVEKWKVLIFCSKQILYYWEKLKAIEEVTVIIVKFYNFCNGLPSWSLTAETKKPWYTTAYVYLDLRLRK
jgi:hypothetical protein